MNLAHHAAVLWRFRGVVAVGLALGIILAVLASYSISFSGGLKVTPRGVEKWGSNSRLQVTQSGFPEGRVTLPPVPTDPKTGKAITQRDRLLYADPARFSALAAQYAEIALGDEVRSRLPGEPLPEQITAIQAQGSAGGITLPIIDLSTTADTAAGALALNNGLATALRFVLKTKQDQAGIGPLQRVQLTTLKSLSEPVLLAGRSKTGSILALLLSIIGVIAVTHLLAALKDGDEGEDDAPAPTSAASTATRPQPAATTEQPVALRPWVVSDDDIDQSGAARTREALRAAQALVTVNHAGGATSPGSARPTLGGAGGTRRRTRGETALYAVLAIGILAAFGAAALRLPVTSVLATLVFGLVVVSYQRTLLAWPTLLGLIIVVILVIPIRRYTIAGNLPIELEPYRVVIALVLACWFCALAADRCVVWRNTGFDTPILVFWLALIGSLALNIDAVNRASDIVLKQVSFFVSFFLVLYLVASVMSAGPKLDSILRLFVGGGGLVAAAALVEWRTGTNAFTGLGSVLPFLQPVDLGENLVRGIGARAFGSAEHPIALGAALVMLVPLSLYLYLRDKHWIWLLCATLLTLGAFSTGSRTCAVMMIVTGLTFLAIKPKGTLRLAPMVLPLIVVIQVVMPGTLGTFRAILQPSYIIKEQSYDQGTGAGRIADLGPSLAEFSRTPFLGEGFATRFTLTNGQYSGAILDNQWLGMLLEIGAIGTLGLLWLYCRAIRRLAQRARSDTELDGWLACALAASLTAFAVGMFTFDAFSFTQVTFFSFIMLGFAAVVTRGQPQHGAAPAQATAPVPSNA